MKNMFDKLNVFLGGQRSFERSNSYHERVDKIRADIYSKYKPILQLEKNFWKRLVLRYKRNAEFRREVRKLTDWNLHSG